VKKASRTRKPQSDKHFVAGTQRLFAVLEALSQQPKAGLPLEEVTQICGLPKTTVYRLLYSMQKLGYVEQDPVTTLYCLSGKFFEMGANALPYQRLTVIAKPLMQTLLLSFGESVNLAVPKSGGAIYVAVLESPKPHRVAASVGGFSFLHSTSVGKSIAAYLSDEDRERQLNRHGLPPLTPATVTSRQQLEEELARVRSEGVALDNEENAPGIICVGGPIFASAKEPIAALSVSGPSVRMSQNLPTIKTAVREAVQTISTLLGWNPDPVEERQHNKHEGVISPIRYRH
jgi:IclR family transcriptional regulator, KDG regulon repressor